jgi:hypothetical protein
LPSTTLSSIKLLAFEHEPDRSRDRPLGLPANHTEVDPAVAGEAVSEVILLRGWQSAPEKESENKPVPDLKSQLSNCVNLPLQLDLDDLETLFGLVLRQVSKGVHVLHRSGFASMSSVLPSG